MSAGELMHSQLVATAGVSTRVSADMRAAGTALPCIVYEIKTNELLTTLQASVTNTWKASVDCHIIAQTLAACATVAAAIVTGFEGATWTGSYGTAIRSTIEGQVNGVIDDSTPGATDLTRTITVTILLFHKD